MMIGECEKNENKQQSQTTLWMWMIDREKNYARAGLFHQKKYIRRYY